MNSSYNPDYNFPMIYIFRKLKGENEVLSFNISVYAQVRGIYLEN